MYENSGQGLNSYNSSPWRWKVLNCYFEKWQFSTFYLQEWRIILYIFLCSNHQTHTHVTDSTSIWMQGAAIFYWSKHDRAIIMVVNRISSRHNYAEYNNFYTYIIENGVWTGTFNVTINEHLCKYNVTKSVTFITETSYSHNCYPHLARNINISNKKMSLNMFKTKKKIKLF